MKKLLIVKASSRLGMKFLPHGGTELNLGVEKGPDAVVTPALLKSIAQEVEPTVIDFTFSDPESTSDEKYYEVVASETDALAKRICDELSANSYDGVVTIGGDHGIGLATVLGILRTHKGKKVGIIDFDSHADIHRVGTSPSGNFHGMWIRPFFGDFDNKEVGDVVDVRISPESFMYIGNMLTEDEEERFIGEQKLAWIKGDRVKSDPTVLDDIKEFCGKHDIIHITFDIDVYKQSLVSATGTPNPDGFDTEMVESCLRRILDSGKIFSLDIVEVNPDKPNPEKTIELAQNVLREFVK